MDETSTNSDALAGTLAIPEALRACGPLTTYAAIRAAARKHPHAEALIALRDHDIFADPAVISCAQFLADLHRCANLCTSLGLGRSDRVVIILPLLASMQAILWGVQSVAVALPVNPFLEAQALRGLMRASRARAVFVAGPGDADGVWANLQAIRANLPDLRHVICLRGGDGDAQGLDYASACADLPGERLLARQEPRESDLAACFHTGGTTGAPKLAMLTHGAMMAKCWATRLALGERENERALLALPLFHVLGALIVSLRMLATGKTIVMAPPAGFRHEALVRNLWKLTGRFRLTDIFAVPTVYAALAHIPPEDADIRSLKRLYTGASTVPPAQCAAMKAMTGLDLLEGYGMTEVCGLASISPPAGGGPAGSAGASLPFHPLRTVQLDPQGRFERFCAPGETGIIALSGPGMSHGYLDPEQSKALFIDTMPAQSSAGGRWLNSGDLGRLDDHGHIWITGRAKDLIIRGGHNIDPRIIEDALYAHDAVLMAAAVAMPDRHSGERPLAYVELKSGAQASEAALLRFARARISERAAVPAHVHILPVMPQTAMGKIFKPTLVQDAARRAFAKALHELAPYAHARISTRDDARRGMVVHIRFGKPLAAASRERIRAGLSRFAAPHTLHWAN